jgi:hypothetical protein
MEVTMDNQPRQQQPPQETAPALMPIAAPVEAQSTTEPRPELDSFRQWTVVSDDITPPEQTPRFVRRQRSLI